MLESILAEYAHAQQQNAVHDRHGGGGEAQIILSCEVFSYFTRDSAAKAFAYPCEKSTSIRYPARHSTVSPTLFCYAAHARGCEALVPSTH
jgi:hypothetical protein